MKIRGKVDELAQDAVKLALQKANERSKVQGAKQNAAEEAHTSRSERIDLSLGRAIHQILDPQAMAEERRAKVEELKRLVQSGQYNPSSLEVARALGQEISFSLFENPKVAGNE